MEIEQTSAIMRLSSPYTHRNVIPIIQNRAHRNNVPLPKTWLEDGDFIISSSVSENKDIASSALISSVTVFAQQQSEKQWNFLQNEWNARLGRILIAMRRKQMTVNDVMMITRRRMMAGWSVKSCSWPLREWYDGGIMPIWCIVILAKINEAHTNIVDPHATYLSFHDSGIIVGHTTRMHWTIPLRRKHPVNKLMLVYMGQLNITLIPCPLSL